MAERRAGALVLERAVEGVPRRVELAALPEALAEAVPRVVERRLELDGVGEQPLGLVREAALLGGGDRGTRPSLCASSDDREGNQQPA